ncbi:hypothetical protein H2202_003295 [Exophiala xenobiotica]|nr:hypothetical protein H2202_003295 [Exophiala xenobiotica]KAK5210824.1 hypothetical protein LTR41_003436 [Exophiala xenobiotica]KAK5224847.1 hypothetical protein LTR72_004628 [Exophiala xenobiotica]KAK5237279.1 hypothetical protein LTR47_001545 [Exophiala xenobiotica]KAK5249225.1 hypothetical protein LTS06_005879 [Exophiala xenobiotica]
MAPRRTVSDRPRGWSQESSDSQEELILYRGNRIVKEPQRQPVVPPTSQRAQEDEGFARFLKKHASPTHQRVTTGGRIVPMEQRPRPPPFPLANSKQEKEPGFADDVDNEGERSGIDPQTSNPEMNSQVKPRAEGADGQFVNPQVHMLANTNVMPGPVNVNLMATADAFSMDAPRVQAPLFPGLLTPPMFPSMYDPFGVPGGQLYPASTLPLAAPLTGFSGNMDGPYSMHMLPSPELTYFPVMDAMPAAQNGVRLPEDLHSNKMLQDSITRFNDLDQQLKNLDRHRAMGERDPQLIGQRITIVELRADAKAAMNYWTSVVENELKALGQQSVDRPTSTLNVEAAAYVPLGANKVPSPTDNVHGSAKSANNTTNIALKAPPKAGPHRIPIVAPPEKAASGRGMNNDNASDADSVEVDEWGSRIGDPPEEIQAQQSEMLLKLGRELSISPQASFHSGDAISPAVVTHPLTLKSSPLKHQLREAAIEQNEEKESDKGEWLPPQPGRAPPTVEAFYEVQLDAMRLPKGTTTKVRLPDGSISEIAGQGLRRPPSFDMDEFERRYWTEKPELSSEMAANFVDITANADNICADRKNQKENALVVLNHCSSGSPERLVSDFGAPGIESARALKPPRFGRKAYTSITAASTESETALSTWGQPTPTSPQRLSRDKAGWSASEQSKLGLETAYDTAIAKGYSSVSVQNVHAMGRLPHMLDGATDNQRRSAMSLLSAAGKVRSPPLVRSPAAPATRFYGGSQDREIGGVTLEGDDIFRPQSAKQEVM